jgi:hypothetical protein
MKSPGLLFLVAIAALSLLVGLPRAGVEFGNRGLMAYGELVLSPAACCVMLGFWAFPAPLPPRHRLVIYGWIVAILTTLLMMVAALFGVGSLVH